MQPNAMYPGVAQPTQGSLPQFKANKPLTMEELAKQTWKSTDLVRVINIDTEPFEWDVANSNNDVIVQPDRVTYEVYRSNPEHYRLEPGESNIYYGYAAYILANGLYKTVLQREGKASRMSDTSTQKLYLDKIFLGVVDPLELMREKQLPKAEPKDVTKDLGLGDEPDLKRPAKA